MHGEIDKYSLFCSEYCKKWYTFVIYKQLCNEIVQTQKMSHNILNLIENCFLHSQLIIHVP